MFQLKAECGYEIVVIGKGENGLCRVDRDNRTHFSGTYAECVRWLNDRDIKVRG